jgi:hypothetical protein
LIADGTYSVGKSRGRRVQGLHDPVQRRAQRFAGAGVAPMAAAPHIVMRSGTRGEPDLMRGLLQVDDDLISAVELQPQHGAVAFGVEVGGIGGRFDGGHGLFGNLQITGVVERVGHRGG